MPTPTPRAPFHSNTVLGHHGRRSATPFLAQYLSHEAVVFVFHFASTFTQLWINNVASWTTGYRLSVTGELGRREVASRCIVSRNLCFAKERKRGITCDREHEVTK